MSKTHNRQEFRFLIVCAIFFGVVFWFLPSKNNRLSEVECERLLVLGEEKYRIDFQFDDSWDFENPTCSSPEIAILSALHFIDTSVVILPSSEKEFDFYQWGKSIRPIFQRKNILAFSAKANFDERRIDISNLELEKIDPVSISNILVHELRHLEEEFNSHVPCTKQRNTTCDLKLQENPFKGGAYNYNVIYLHRLIEYGALTRSQKYFASDLLKDILETRINFISDEARKKYTP